MKHLLTLLLILLGFSEAQAQGGRHECMADQFNLYSKEFQKYWDMTGEELGKVDAPLYSEFKYLITEQKNSNELQRITLDYLLRYDIEQLRMDGSVYSFVPRFANYFEETFRKLRQIARYDRIYLENRSYEHNGKMPDFDRLQKVSQLIASIQEKPVLQSQSARVRAIGEKLIVDLCGS